MKGWQIEGGERIVLNGERMYVRDAHPTMGNIIYLDVRTEDGVLGERKVLTEQEVERLD